MTETALSVEVKDSNIIVTQPDTDLEVTYRKDEYSPMLVAADLMRFDSDAEQVAFFARAWKAAYDKAKILGWL
jgi:hypothetical protein